MKRLLAKAVRPTIRVRLAVLYGVSFLIAGTILVVIMYLLVRNQLQPGVALVAPGSAPTSGPFTEPVPQDRILVDRVTGFVRQSLRALLWQSGVVLACAALLAVGLGWLLAGRALAPLQQVTETARRVSERGLHERIGMKGANDEVRQLADTFDAMLERLDRAFDAQRRFVGNASHELRTPLAINRTLLEVAAGDPAASQELRSLIKPLLATNARTEKLIDGLLFLARSEQLVVDPKPVDLIDVAAAAAQLIKPEAQDRNIAVRETLVPAPTRGEPVLLERLAVNLLENGVRHNQPGGTVAIATTQTTDGAVLEVCNSGPVVPEYEVDSLFEPFRRGSGRVVSEGSGLGLSIVRAIATAHGGDARAHPNQEGGLTVRVTLPLRGSRRCSG